MIKFFWGIVKRRLEIILLSRIKTTSEQISSFFFVVNLGLMLSATKRLISSNRKKVSNTEQFHLPSFIDNEDGLRRVHLVYLDFVFSQAEKRLSEQVRNAEQITTRGYSLLGVEITVSTFVFGFIVNNFDKAGEVLLLAGFFAIPLLIGAIYFAVKCIWPYGFDVPGSEPHKVLLGGFVVSDEAEEQKKALIISEIKNYQERIRNNMPINRRRLRHFTVSLIFLAFIPACLLLAWVVLHLVF